MQMFWVFIIASAGLCFCLLPLKHVQAAAVENYEEASTGAPTKDLNLPEECHQPREMGRCFALFYRYAYDVEKAECVQFIYGGCNGNSNNFETKLACEQKCLHKSEENHEASTTGLPENSTMDEKANSS